MILLGSGSGRADTGEPELVEVGQALLEGDPALGSELAQLREACDSAGVSIAIGGQ
jgi:hypothetical protein